MKMAVHIIHAFADDNQGGNPAGVVLDAQRLTRGQKMKIAAKVGRSETAFVSPSESADFKLEFFTPTRQIAHCGHATIATFVYLKEIGEIGAVKSSKETIDGNREILFEGGMAFMEQRAPQYTEIGTHSDDVLDSLRLRREDLIQDTYPVIVDTGNSFLLLPLASENAVSRADPEVTAVVRISEKYDLIGYYLFSTETRLRGRDAGARMFAPRYGIPEESATGMAAGPLACFLFDKLKVNKNRYLVEQGVLMQPASPSLIHVKLETAAGKIQRLMTGGTAQVRESICIDV